MLNRKEKQHYEAELAKRESAFEIAIKELRAEHAIEVAKLIEENRLQSEEEYRKVKKDKAVKQLQDDVQYYEKRVGELLSSIEHLKSRLEESHRYNESLQAVIDKLIERLPSVDLQELSVNVPCREGK